MNEQIIPTWHALEVGEIQSARKHRGKNCLCLRKLKKTQRKGWVLEEEMSTMSKIMKEGIWCIKWTVKKVKRIEELHIRREEQIAWYHCHLEREWLEMGWKLEAEVKWWDRIIRGKNNTPKWDWKAVIRRYRMKVWDSNKKEKYLHGNNEGYLGVRDSPSLITFHNHTM